MWMMGCSDDTSLHTSDSHNGRKLRPLIPRPTTGSSTTERSSSCFNHTHSSTDLFAFHNHLEQGKQASIHPVSSRWNPTPEQLRTLEDLYRRGTRTPSAEQIQHITAQLRRYGKIEGKNVFYWFQNHKARERQKRRRQIEAAMVIERDSEGLERKYSAMCRTEGCKDWSPTNCSILTEESAPASKAQNAKDGWLQCDGELHHQSSSEGYDTWHLMHLSSFPHLINTTQIATAATTAAYDPADPKILTNGSFDIDDEYGQSQTLELFPLRSNGIVLTENTPSMPTAPTTTAMANLGPYQFFQFL